MSKLTRIVGHDIGYGSYDNPDKVQIRWGDHMEWFVKESIKDNAYAERNKLLALVCRMAIELDFPVELWRHPDSEEWEDDWRNIVALLLPAGQCTWHIHDSELPMFEFLPKGENRWDGHTTEEKYQRVLDFRIYQETNEEDRRTVEILSSAWTGLA